ncbi:hypothetical protein O3P69_008084 [Scylla paramamosain]|uniref:Uncharacterized protein n=1 Tax=Scylla paramamosain TaxID=85552 RepID=A0AAW0SZQ8_SCYPA
MQWGSLDGVHGGPVWRTSRTRDVLQHNLVSATRVHVASMATLCEKVFRDTNTATTTTTTTTKSILKVFGAW